LLKRKVLSCYLHTGYNIKFILRLLYYIYYSSIKKSFFFCENNLKKLKALQQRPKGLEWSGSPNKTIFELFA